MSYALKDLYSPVFYANFTKALKSVSPKASPQKFKRLIFDERWEERELKERMRHTAQVLHHFMPQDFAKACALMKRLVKELEENGIRESSVEYMFLPDYLELYGLDHRKEAVSAMEWLTTFTSCEFAIRPFIQRYPQVLMRQLQLWSKHENHHVRRLSSEGCRPRLPWAMALPDLKKDPAPILPILERLKDDPSEYVRRSVANNLNDISKDHPELVLRIGEKWKGKSKEVDWIVKHSCRTLLKQGNSVAMSLFGYSAVEALNVSDFIVHTPKVTIGDHLEFSFQLHNQSQAAALVRIEYGIHYLKANGSHSRKVFKISEKEIASESEVLINRQQSFRIITTRKFYPGLHAVSLILNGISFGQLDFELVE